MKYLYISVFVFLIPTTSVFGQSADELMEKKDSLNLIIEVVDLEIEKLEYKKEGLQKQIYSIDRERNRLEIEQEFQKGIEVAVNDLGAKLRDKPSSKVFVNIPTGDTVLVLDWYEPPYFKAIYKDNIGFISSAYLIDNNAIRIRVKEGRPKEPKVSDLTKMYGYENARRIRNNQYWIGMTTVQAMLSLGKPNDINKSVGVLGVQEQWVYRGKDLYLYFEDGILTSFQK